MKQVLADRQLFHEIAERPVAHPRQAAAVLQYVFREESRLESRVVA
jgi:hypothetical protein